MNDIHLRTYVTIPQSNPELQRDGGWERAYGWCESYCHEDGWWYLGDGVFEFNSDRDAFLFKLKWS